MRAAAGGLREIAQLPVEATLDGAGAATGALYGLLVTLMFSLVMLPPHVPHPRLAVIGMPLSNKPALPRTLGCRTMIRLTGAIIASR